MSRGRARDDRDGHRRFGEWLLTAADDEPPRDLAVHASVCPDCQRQIAALDMLTGIELANAGMPPARAGRTERRIGVAGRVAVAVSGVAAVAAIGVGGWRLVDATGIGATPDGESPAQEVLGNTGQPQATTPPSPSGELSGPPSPSVSPSPSATPLVGSPPGVMPVTTPPPVTTRPPAATARPTRTPRPTSTPPSPTPAPTATPEPTPEATPTPVETPTPVPEAA